MTWFILICVVAIAIGTLRSNQVQEYFYSRGLKETLTASEKQTLQKYFEFYRQLPDKSKKIFEYRVSRFRELTEFIPRDMSAVSEEMEILISASAVQLTFGFDNVFLDHFERIIIYPDQFFSTSGQRFHKGEVNPQAKAIVLSWKHFVEGYAAKEGINLGLHEMAHALQLENIIMNDEFGFMDDDDIRVWQQLAAEEIVRINTGTGKFFRAYGGVDHAEFFAVAVENYFERPKEFKAYDVKLYNTMCRLLKQDPILLMK